MDTLFKTKTFWASVVGIVTAVGAYFTGDLAAAEALQTVFTGLVAIFLRDGIAKA